MLRLFRVTIAQQSKNGTGHAIISCNVTADSYEKKKNRVTNRLQISLSILFCEVLVQFVWVFVNFFLLNIVYLTILIQDPEHEHANEKIKRLFLYFCNCIESGILPVFHYRFEKQFISSFYHIKYFNISISVPICHWELGTAIINTSLAYGKNPTFFGGMRKKTPHEFNVHLFNCSILMKMLNLFPN